ncbi:MAG: hypothetical protein A2887_06845 [Alphaproteobacteria bacterium RIFCSPLOWO2_01_FULL_40_26]|nr:MAG: hypothetical protein A2887_06845 [Alphaproteobacteria bacterium RIFCSPLOWO2_01_FULL_40_26]
MENRGAVGFKTGSRQVLNHKSNMLYHPFDNKFTILLKHLVFWAALFSMFALFVFLVFDDTKILQKEVILKIDIKDKVNICLPEDEKIFQKSFFDF